MKSNPFLIAVSVLLGFAISSHADPIVLADVTTTLGPNFFFDTAAIGGGDFTSANTNFTRNFGIGNYSFNPASTNVSISGIGFALVTGTTTATSVTATITYLGSDGVVGGGDDAIIGSAVTDSLTMGATGEYAWKFTAPLTATHLVWDLNGVSTVTLQRSTTLGVGGFTNVPGKINTTSTSFQEISADPKAFFRLATP